MLETPYPIDQFPDPYRKPMPGDFNDIPENSADRPDTLHTGENSAPAGPQHHRMSRLYHTSCTGMPYDMPDAWGLLPGDMPMLYDLWGLWS